MKQNIQLIIYILLNIRKKIIDLRTKKWLLHEIETRSLQHLFDSLFLCF